MNEYVIGRRFQVTIHYPVITGICERKIFLQYVDRYSRVASQYDRNAKSVDSGICIKGMCRVVNSTVNHTVLKSANIV
jgi:hypothetical protein